MKKISKLLAAAVGLASVLFAGCSDLSAGSASVTYSVNDTTVQADYNVYFASANGSILPLSSVGVGSSSSSRTIVADALTLSSLHFYLW